MAATPDQIAQDCDAAADAMGRGEYATALSRLLAAKARLMALPDGGAGGMSATWNRDSIDQLIRDCRQQAAMNRGIQVSRTRYRGEPS